jgi:hypothetical protein
VKPLGDKAAAACENATNTRCRCRCKGVFHGAKRVGPEQLRELPISDPHYPDEQPELPFHGPKVRR